MKPAGNRLARRFRNTQTQTLLRGALVIGLVLIYTFTLPENQKFLGGMGTSLLLIPILLVGQFWGLPAGWIAGILGSLLHFGLMVSMGRSALETLQSAWIGYAIFVGAGYASGLERKRAQERNRYEAELRQHLHEQRLLLSVSQALVKTERTGPERVLQLIADSVRELIPKADQAVIHLLDEDSGTLIPRAVSGIPPLASSSNVRMSPGKGVAGQVIRDRIVINIPNVFTDPRFRMVDTPVGYRSLLVAPVISEHCAGTISVQSSQPAAFSKHDEELLQVFSSQAAIALENARFVASLQRSYREVEILYRIAQRLVTTLEDADALMQDVVDLLQEHLKYDQVSILLVEPATQDLIVKHISGEHHQALQGYRIPAGQGIVGHVVQRGEPFLTNDVWQIPFYLSHPLLTDILAELAVPIQAGSQITGILDVQQRAPHRLGEQDLHLVQAVAEQVAVALQKAALYTDLQTALHQEKAIRSQLLQSERLAVAGRLLASVSHELNNPLQAIQNALFLLKDEPGLSDQGRQDLQIILSETERMAALLERLRASYRPIRSGEFRPVSLNGLIEDVYALLSTHLHHRRIAFEFHPHPALPAVAGLEDQLRQVIINLFLNAADAMADGGRLIVTTAENDHREVILTVADTGPGIDPSLLPRIFEAFFTTKQGGTGLGLTIAQEIVQHHGGRITAANAPQGGAIFTVCLPACSDSMP